MRWSHSTVEPRRVARERRCRWFSWRRVRDLCLVPWRTFSETGSRCDICTMSERAHVTVGIVDSRARDSGACEPERPQVLRSSSRCSYHQILCQVGVLRRIGRGGPGTRAFRARHQRFSVCTASGPCCSRRVAMPGLPHEQRRSDAVPRSCRARLEARCVAAAPAASVSTG